MPSRSTAARLQDILENIRLARSFVAGLSFADFQADLRLPAEIKARHTEIEWIDVAGAGSIYRHDYHAVSDDLIWQTVQQDLEPLRIAVEQELNSLKARA